jgi:hypothetical protein
MDISHPLLATIGGLTLSKALVRRIIVDGVFRHGK